VHGQTTRVAPRLAQMVGYEAPPDGGSGAGRRRRLGTIGTTPLHAGRPTMELLTTATSQRIIRNRLLRMTCGGVSDRLVRYRLQRSANSVTRESNASRTLGTGSCNAYLIRR
jgi:hypothetical protein